MMHSLCIWENESNYSFNKDSAEYDCFSPPAGDFLIHNTSNYKDALIARRKSRTNKNTAGKVYFGLSPWT